MRFRNHRIVGEIVELAERYCGEGADELVFYDITASPDGRSVDRGWVGRVTAVLDIPFCVAGGIRSVADAEEILNKGADKLSINSPALENPALISELARRFGSQCVVVGVDSQEEGGGYYVHRLTGDVEKSASTKRETLAWIREAQDRGAGEIVLNCMNRDGVRQGYDCAQLASVRQQCNVPLIASGGAGRKEHFAEVFRNAAVDGALAASIFHSGEMRVDELKRFLEAHDIDVRPTQEVP
ncbi:MAG: HisA/HisF-related TIM barrel protein [Woeseia sp.]